MYKKIINTAIGKKFAFSLVEILMSVLIVSLVLVAMAPILTKKMTPKKNAGVVYTYKNDGSLTDTSRCLLTSVTYDGNFTETYTASTECTQYTFTVPSGVTRVNLTLAAGGGGGGGAAGGTVETKDLVTDNTSGSSPTFAYSTKTTDTTTIPITASELIKNLKILYLSAKGEDGGDAGEHDGSSVICGGGSGYVCGGKGGASSPAVYDFDIPESYIRGVDYTGSLDYTSPNDLTYTVSNESNAGYFNIGDTVKYGVTSDHYVYCAVSTANSGDPIYSTSDDSNDFSTYCKIPGDKIKDSVEGEYGTYIKYDTTVHAGDILTGGTGGKNNLLSGGNGMGGSGQYNEVLYCNSGLECDAVSTGTNAAAVYNTLSNDTEGKIGSTAVQFTFEHPGGTGGGGAAGSVVRIMNFAVTPDETYTVIVGKGGAGGAGSASSNNPSSGSNGMGGTSTAVYDSSGNLIYMVNGGAGGQGGSAWDGTAYTGESGLSGRNYALLMSSSANYFSNITFDEDIINDSNSGNISVIFNNVSTLQLIRLIYTELQEEPYATLNNRKSVLNGTFTNYTGTALNKNGGYSVFDDTVNIVSSVYDGLYLRGLVNGTGAYIGGLGGFSGLGNKTGCGGFFMGNFDGRIKADGTLPSTDDARRENLNTFTLKKDNNNDDDNDTYVTYNVFDYYDNCTAANSNGQTAEFIMPKPYSSLGSASSGGGGGGYHIKSGAGKGGNGQDGYVMIEWRK